MKLSNLLSFLHTIAPDHLQEDYDNAGLITGHRDMEISGVLVCLDAIEEVIDEAISLNCNVVIAHHPIVFRGLKRFNGSNYVERTVIKAIKHDIAIFAIHTNLDNVYQNGVNAMISNKIGLINTEILSPLADIKHNDMPVGAGMLGYLPAPMKTDQFLHHLKTQMDLRVVKHTAICKDEIHKVAVCGGSGSFLLKQAKISNADICVTSDFKSHEYFDADGAIIIADIGHFESERFTKNYIVDYLTKKIPNFAVNLSQINTNPVKYL